MELLVLTDDQRIKTGVPVHATVTGGELTEQARLAEHVRPRCFCLIDRGSQSFGLPADMLEAGSDLVLRRREDMVYETLARRRPKNANAGQN